MVRLLVVEPAYLDSSPRLGMGARIYLKLFQDLTGDVVLVVCDVSCAYVFVGVYVYFVSQKKRVLCYE